MKSGAKCTVLMPLYNKEKYIETAIKSVLNQSMSHDIELVIADDCSTDEGLKIAQKYGELYPDIITVLTSEKNQGLMANDIRVYENMKTEYFCVLDPDDYWIDDDFLKRAVNFLDENRDFVCYGANTILNKEGKDIGVYIPTDIKQYVTNSIEDYLKSAIEGGVLIVPHTTASVYRNAIFKNRVPEIIRNAVGTISEASFRADHDRFVIHLKYGKAIFVNDLVGVYRMTKEGIWSGAAQIHRDLLDAQAKFDYSTFYNNIYWEEFRETARPYYIRILKEMVNMLQRGEALSPEDELIFQNVAKEFKREKCDMETTEVERAISGLKNRINKIESLLKCEAGMQQELIWANIFHDTIRGSEWLPQNLALSPGRWALGYPGLYVLYRTLDEMKPLSILELGLGQSTKVIGSYVNYMNEKGYDCHHCVVEHDKNWIDFFTANNNTKGTKIIQLDMQEIEFDIEGIGKTGVNIYVEFQQKLQSRKFDMIFIDAPLGSEEYSRIDVVNILPDCLEEQFVLMMDDCDRKGEMRGLQLIESVLQENQIAYSRGFYQGEKATALLVSKGRLDFLTSM